MFERPYVPIIALFIMIIVCVVITIALLCVVRLRQKKVDEMTKRLSVSDYTVPEFVSTALVITSRMYEFYTFLHYFLSVSSMICSVFAIAFAATTANAVGVEIIIDAIVMLSAFALLFSALNYLINPLKTVNTVQLYKTKFEIEVMAITHNKSINNDEKDLKIIELWKELSNEYNLKLHF